LNLKEYFGGCIENFIPNEQMREEYEKINRISKDFKKFDDSSKRSCGVQDLVISFFILKIQMKMVISIKYNKETKELFRFVKICLPKGENLSTLNKPKTVETKVGDGTKKIKVLNVIGFSLFYYKYVDYKETLFTNITITSLTPYQFINNYVFSKTVKKNMDAHFDMIKKFKIPEDINFFNMHNYEKDNVVFVQIKELMTLLNYNEEDEYKKKISSFLDAELKHIDDYVDDYFVKDDFIDNDDVIENDTDNENEELLNFDY
jgi:hypothetical protein